MNGAAPLRALAALTAVLAASGCIASNVVAEQERMVVADFDRLPFAPAPDLVLDGLYESVDLRGEAAVSLRKIYYHFAPDGTYTAAALTDQGGVLFFQSRRGTWRNSVEGLSLDGGAPVRLERAGDFLRVTAPSGTLVLERQPWH